MDLQLARGAVTDAFLLHIGDATTSARHTVRDLETPGLTDVQRLVAAAHDNGAAIQATVDAIHQAPSTQVGAALRGILGLQDAVRDAMTQVRPDDAAAVANARDAATQLRELYADVVRATNVS